MLNLLRSNRMERLLDELLRLMQSPPPPPLEPEWICVQSQGLRTWLSLEIAGRTGICANVVFPFPREMVEDILGAVLQEPSEPMKRFRAEYLTWVILALLPPLLAEEAFAPLRRYLEGDPKGIKRFQLARQIAQTFDEYGVYRWRTLLAWERQPPEAWNIDPADRWQPILWNAVIGHLGAEHLAAKAERMLQTPPPYLGTPRRLFLFGISTLPPLFMEILAHLARGMEIYLFVLSPSREYFADTRSRAEQARALRRRGIDGAGPDTVHLFSEGHPLLASLGRLGRDFQEVLEETAAGYHEADTDLYEDPLAVQPPSLLCALQSDILHLRSRGREAGVPRMSIPCGDRSITIHSCHSPMRETQVLKDQLLARFSQDPTLHPHDVMVMTPDIEAYAPYIEAVFGARDGERPAIPFSISDRRVQGEAAVAEAFTAVLRVARSRLAAREVFDLLALEPVRRKHSLSTPDVEKLQDWVLAAGIRWGIDPDHRRQAQQPPLYENTWRFGLDRLLLGYALPETGSDLFEGVLPLEGIEGPDAEIFSRFVGFCETLFVLVRDFQTARPPEKWCQALEHLRSTLLENTPHNAGQHQLIRDILADWLDQTRAAGFDAELPLDLVLRVLEDRFSRTTSTHGFMKGGVTFCNLVPMRSIPFKAVCLLGMNEQGFPRTRPAVSFNLMARRPAVGDRSLRTDDRYLFLEALLSARRYCIITYVGQHIQTNEPIPPSTVVSELLDAVNDGFDRPGDARAADALTLVHPLQPFSGRCFEAGSPFAGYSPTFYQGALALAGRQTAREPFCQAFLAEAPPDPLVISLAELIRFFQNPTAHFLSRRLGMHLGEDAMELKDREPLFLDRLEAYPIGSALLEAGVRGTDVCGLYPFMCAKGVLPPGNWGRSSYNDLVDQVHPVCRAVLGEACDRPLDPVRLDLPVDGARLVGRIDGLYPGCRLAYRYALLKARDRLAVWLCHLALNALSGEGLPRQSVLVGRSQGGFETWRLPPVTGQAPLQLAKLVSLYREGQLRPLPFFPEAALAFARAWQKAGNGAGREPKALAAARRAWTPGRFQSGEATHPAVQQVFGQTDPLAGKDFQSLALDIFTPMLTAEAEA